MRYLASDPFLDDAKEEYDLVYWDNALHHMPDAFMAVQWSRKRLRRGGFFIFNDFVGPTRFQWSDFNIATVARYRSCLPKRLLQVPGSESIYYPTSISRPSVSAMLDTDPSEAADSASICKAARHYFPGIEIIPLGGCIYHSGLNDILANFTEADMEYLNLGLLVDDLCILQGHTQYAAGFARVLFD